jgi:small nuclear ribonucleoprotein (snRNP)-like protein
MYDIDSLIGKTVTLKTISGMEIISQLASFDDENKIIGLLNPKLVVVTNEQIAVIPYTFTSKAESIFISLTNILSVTESLETSADDYSKVVEDDSKELADK